MSDDTILIWAWVGAVCLILAAIGVIADMLEEFDADHKRIQSREDHP